MKKRTVRATLMQDCLDKTTKILAGGGWRVHRRVKDRFFWWSCVLIEDPTRMPVGIAVGENLGFVKSHKQKNKHLRLRVQRILEAAIEEAKSQFPRKVKPEKEDDPWERMAEGRVIDIDAAKQVLLVIGKVEEFAIGDVYCGFCKKPVRKCECECECLQPGPIVMGGGRARELDPEYPPPPIGKIEMGVCPACGNYPNKCLCGKLPPDAA